METREIGKTGIQISAIGLGCNNFGFFQDRAQATACVRAALDAGITFFDMASEHGVGLEEALVGAALGSRRKDVVIATKFGQQELVSVKPDGTFQMSSNKTRQGTSRRWIMQSVEESLKRLRTDYIDVYQLHVIDGSVTPEETLRTLDDLVRQGKVRAIGLAATDATANVLVKFQEVAQANSLTSFAAMQSQYSLLVRQAEVDIIPELRARHMSLLPFWPLANGLLTGKYRKGMSDPVGSRLTKLPFVRDFYGPEHWARLDAIRAFARARDMSMVELALAWLLSEPVVVSVVAGASEPQQVRENAAAGGTRLSETDRADLSRLTR